MIPQKTKTAFQQLADGPPWANPETWQQANEWIAERVRQCHRQLDAAYRLATGIQHLLHRAEAPLDRLCAVTCPACEKVCCHHARIWYDFKDLIYLQLTGRRPPDSQPIRCFGQPCTFCTPTGCRLDRSRRPFVCTWYLCPAQTAAGNGSSLGATISRIKGLRNRMEDAFVMAVQ